MCITLKVLTGLSSFLSTNQGVEIFKDTRSPNGHWPSTRQAGRDMPHKVKYNQVTHVINAPIVRAVLPLKLSQTRVRGHFV